VDREENAAVNRKQIYASRHLAGRVQRYHAWPVLHIQTVAEHSCRVAQIVVEIFGMPRAEVLYCCLHHDSGELWTGDVPFSVKQHNPAFRAAYEIEEQYGLRMLKLELPKLTEQERAQVKIADLTEMWETGCVEFIMGNRFAESIVSDTLHAAKELAIIHKLSESLDIWLMNHELRNIVEDLR
jgi:5'-deoxynucleotidase YfbR-like HD superfamily hydrolase